MNLMRGLSLAAGIGLSLVTANIAAAADWNAKPADFVVKDFRFHTGQTLPELKIHYVTIGDPKGVPVLVLHGTAQSSAAMLSPAFAGQLFGSGQPLDSAKYFIIIPDGLGTGASTKPSDGLHAHFPDYDYVDMVEAQYRLVTEGLGLKHLRLIIGNSMGGMHVWVWGAEHAGFADLLVPMASQPTAMSSRNWMMRRLIIDSIRNDPDWNGGDYITQPKSAQFASVFYGIATAGGTLAYQAAAPTREKADALLDARLREPFTGDANDILYQWAASRDYDVAPDLDRITDRVLAINAADDERNPPETGLMTASIGRLKQGELFLIPASAETRGHGTTSFAKFYKDKLRDVLAVTPVKR